MTLNLFDSRSRVESRQERLGPGAWVLRGFATPVEAALLAALQDVIAMVPFRHMVAMSTVVRGWVARGAKQRLEPYT